MGFLQQFNDPNYTSKPLFANLMAAHPSRVGGGGHAGLLPGASPCPPRGSVPASVAQGSVPPPPPGPPGPPPGPPPSVAATSSCCVRPTSSYRPAPSSKATGADALTSKGMPTTVVPGAPPSFHAPPTSVHATNLDLIPPHLQPPPVPPVVPAFTPPLAFAKTSCPPMAGAAKFAPPAAFRPPLYQGLPPRAPDAVPPAQWLGNCPSQTSMTAGYPFPPGPPKVMPFSGAVPSSDFMQTPSITPGKPSAAPSLSGVVGRPSRRPVDVPANEGTRPKASPSGRATMDLTQDRAVS